MKVANETEWREHSFVLFPNGGSEMQLCTEERKSTSTLNLTHDTEMGKYKAFRGQKNISVA